MKTAKKILCVVLAVMMVASLAIVSFADDAPTGKITITNAEAGKTYTLYKLFDATYATVTTTDSTTGETTTTKAVSYTVPADSAVAEEIAKYADEPYTAEAYAAAGEAICPFKLVGDGSEGFYYVEHKAGANLNKTNEAYGRGWAYEHLIEAGLVTKEAEQTLASGNTAVFDVPYGYYAMTPGDGAVITVNTNTPNVDIVDKNPRTPSTPDKTADKTEVIVGDTVTYDASFKATNFYTQSASFTKMIDEYIVKDTSKGLKDKTITSIKLYSTKSEDGVFSDQVGTVPVTSAVKSEDSTDDLTVWTIPWSKTETVNSKEVKTSLYPSPVYVVIEYTATVTDGIFSDLSSLTADNKIKVTYEYDDNGTTKTGDIPDEPEVKIPTIGISLRKVDSQDETVTLEGAEFRLYKMDGNTKKYYAIDDENTYADAKEIKVAYGDGVNAALLETLATSNGATFFNDTENSEYVILVPVANEEALLAALNGNFTIASNELKKNAITTAEATNIVTWVTDVDDAKEFLADNDYDTLEIYGLAPGTYELEEIKAPEGYKLPAEPFELIIAAEDGEYTVTFDGDEVAPQNNRPEAYTLYIANGTGSSLPSTGGAGTVAIIAAGTILFMAAAVVLVTKKRMYNEQ